MACLWFCLPIGLLGGFFALAAAPLRADPPLEAPPVNVAAVSKPSREPLVAPPVTATITPELAALIEQLGDDSFVRREAASAKLADVGMPAKPALQAALKHADPEVRLRVRRLLGQIQAADLEGRLKAFVADTDGRQQHDLPGWPRYRKLVGEDRTARKLFADMHRAEPGLMETSSGGGDAAAEVLQMRAYDLLRGMQTGYISGRTGGTSLGGVAAMLFVAGDERAKVNDTTQMQVYNFVQQPPFQQALRDGTDGPVAKRLLGSWISRQTGVSTAQIGIQLAAQWDLKEGAVPARKVAADKAASAYSRAYAMSALAKLGGKEDLAVLQDLLADRSSYARVMIVDGKRTERNTEMRDVALAALVYLTGQKLEDYGLRNLTPSAPLPFNYSQVHFSNDAAREHALQKWRDWAAKNPVDVGKRAETKTDKAAQGAMRGAVVGGGVFFAGPGVVMVVGGEKADAKPEEELPFYVTDREAGQRLARARQLIEEGRFTPALRVLDAVLAQAGDRSFQPEVGHPLYLSLRLEAERLLGLLPDEGRAKYELLIGSQARRALEEAVAAGEVAGLQHVARRYLASAAGQEAALLVGEHLLDSGRALAAAMVFSALREHDHDRRFEPLLSLRIAHAWLWAGMPQEARAALRQTKAPRDALDTFGSSLEFAGRRLPPLENVEGVLAVLNDVTPMQPSSAPQPGDWALFRGDARRNAAANGQAPWLRSRWRAQTARTQAVRDAIASLASAYRQERLSVLPTGHPLAVGDAVLARTTGELLAIDGNSGEVRWRVPLIDAVDDLMATSGGQPADASAILRGLDERVWNDLTYGTLASDGRCAYLVEDVGLVHGLSAERMVVRPDGSRRLDAGWPGENNRLTAYDLRTGKFRWEIGGPRGEYQLDLAGAYFLGPPLPLAGKLYAMAEANGRICLLALDPADGHLLEQLPLAVLDQPDATARQFSGYAQMPPGRPSRRLSGASPAYAGGVMVCPTSWNSFTAVDVGSGAILWSYRPMRLEEAARTNGNVLVFGLAQSTGAMDDALRRDDRWADCSVTIAGDRVLVTPRENDRLLCLDLRSGRLLWEAPRWDSQYVAAVTGHVGESLRDSQSRLGETRPRAVALLVGRSSLRGLKMADGKPAWDALPLPAGAAPSGRGYLSEGRYYLPLASAEVAVVDPAAGRLLHRAKSPDGRVPGNLVCARNQVISQGAEGIESFPRLDGAIGAAALAVGRQPNDPPALAEYGRMLLARGEHAEAIAQLRRSLELRKDEAVRASLCDAVLEALEADFPTHRQTAVDLAAVFTEAGQEPAYLRATAVGLWRTGERLDAFEAFVKLAGQVAHAARVPADGHASRVSHELQPASAALYTTRDVWLRGQLTDLRAACTPAEQAELDRRIVGRLAKAIESKNTQTLRQWLGVFGDHPRAPAARDALLAQYLDPATGKLLDGGVRPLDVERLLIETQAGPDAERSRAAAVGLARMMGAQGRPEEAAVLYRRLSGELADAVCLAGKTGRQLFDELPADAPVRRVLSATGAWPQGLVEKQTRSGTATRVAQTAWPLNVEAARNSLFDELRLEVTAGVSPQKIIARDSGGNERWSVELKMPDGGAFSPQTLRAKLDGHLLCVWQGNRVLALDTLAAAGKRPGILWSKDLTTRFPGLDGGNGSQQMVIFAGGGVPVFASTDAQGRPVAEIGPLTGQRLCYQSLRALTAVDPLTGETLWSRHDVPRGCELLGDGEVVLALPRDGTTADGTKAVVLRATDGQELGRCEVPDKRDRLAVLGRHVVTWTGGDERQTLRLLDPWQRRNVWTREFPAGSKLARIGLHQAAGHEAAVLDPQGNFTVLSLASGALRVSTRLKPPANLLDIHVLRSPEGYLLLAKQSLPAPAVAAGKPAEKIVYPLSLGGQAEIASGTLYGFDRASGALKWETTIDQRGLDLGQSAHWPILVLAERLYYQGENAPRRYETKVTCLDKRDGRAVFEETSPLTGSQLQVLPHAASHSVEVRTSSATTKLVFTGKPWPAK